MKRIFIIKNGKEVVGSSEYDGFIDHWVKKKKLECYREGRRFMHFTDEKFCSEYNKDDTLKCIYQILVWRGFYLESGDFDYATDTTDG